MLHAIADAPREDARQQAEAMLQHHARFFQEDGLDVATDVVFDSPPVSIVTAAGHLNAMIIAMTTHGYSGFRHWTMGSVTEEVLHATTTPIFVTRAGQPHDPTFNRLLLPVDGTPLSQRAVQAATMLASHSRAHVHMLQAIQPADAWYEGLQPVKMSREQYAATVEAERVQAEKSLAAAADTLRHQGIYTTTRVAIGSPEESILREAVQHDSDLIVMATHGYYGIEQWLVGSVAMKILHETTIPMVLVHAKA
jgi:nucleotide-binding universal stress UspA family protein